MNSRKINCTCKFCGGPFEIFPSVLKREGRGVFCSKKCQGMYRSEHYVGENHWMTGKPSLLKGCKKDPAIGAKISAAKKGVPKSKEHREKLAAALIGKTLSKSTKIKISNALKGRIRSPDHCKHISEVKTGVSRSDMIGGNNPNWKGGTSFEPYCPKFNREFKERVRAFFGYRCAECGMPQNGKSLDVHHVNFDKDTCCNDSIPTFIPLCQSCHGKTQKNRLYWERHFTELITSKYDGKCYLTKEEFAMYRESRGEKDD